MKIQVVGASDLGTVLERVEKLERENKQLKLEIETLKMQIKTNTCDQGIDPTANKSKCQESTGKCFSKFSFLENLNSDNPEMNGISFRLEQHHLNLC